MAEPLSTADRELLADIDRLRVADNDDCCPMLHMGADGDADVSVAVWRFKQLGWAHQPDGPGWRLTELGTAVLAEDPS